MTNYEAQQIATKLADNYEAQQIAVKWAENQNLPDECDLVLSALAMHVNKYFISNPSMKLIKAITLLSDQAIFDAFYYLVCNQYIEDVTPVTAPHRKTVELPTS